MFKTRKKWEKIQSSKINNNKKRTNQMPGRRLCYKPLCTIHLPSQTPALLSARLWWPALRTPTSTGATSKHVSMPSPCASFTAPAPHAWPFTCTCRKLRILAQCPSVSNQNLWGAGQGGENFQERDFEGPASVLLCGTGSIAHSLLALSSSVPVVSVLL